MDKQTILILEDHQIIGELIQHVLSDESNFSIVATVSSVVQAQEKLREKPVDIAIVDLSLPGESGLSLLKWIHKEQLGVKVLVLTMFANGSNVVEAIKYGANGFLPKDTSLGELKQALTQIANGNTYFSPEISSIIVDSIKNDYKKEDVTVKINNLTAREKEILSMVINGNSNVEIAEKIFISVRTVENHRANILRKTSAKNFFELAKAVMENNLLDFASGD